MKYDYVAMFQFFSTDCELAKEAIKKTLRNFLVLKNVESP